jgi:hypothetical protein
MHRRTLVAAVALLASSFAPAAAGGSMKDYYGPTYSHIIFGGGEVVKDSWEVYSGSIWALNRDISKEGVMFRTMGSYGKYQYVDNCPTCTPPSVGNEFDGRMTQVDAMIGYQWVRDRADILLFAGVDHIRHKISPNDPNNSVSGSETGFKIAGEIESRTTTLNLPYYFIVEGSYSTAFDTYYVLGRLGAHRERNIFGVEGWLLGDDTGNAQRLGGFLMFERNLRPDLLAELTLSAGYQFVDDADSKICGSFFGSEGAYATLNLSFKFGSDRMSRPPLK